MKKHFELKNNDLHIKLDKYIINAANDFFKTTSYGTFTLIIQNSKIIGYDCLIKKRITNN